MLDMENFKDDIMLVLSRQKDESIVIGEGEDAVEVMIVDVRGDKVRLGIIAPRSTPVHRREVYDAIQREKAEQAKAPEQPSPDSVADAAQSEPPDKN